MAQCDFTDWREWVAVKKSPFVEKSPKRNLIFNVGWNDFERKFAVSCQARHRVARDNELEAWARLVTYSDLINFNKQLALIYPHVSLHFPCLFKSSFSLWGCAALQSASDEECQNVENYLRKALDICGQALLLSVLFETDENGDDQYLEDINELNQQGYEDAYNRSVEELKSILEMREKTENMLHMATIYALEDEVATNFTISLAELYNYHLQPFLNLRELAYSKVETARSLLNSEDVGNRIKEQMSQEYREWQQQYTKSVDSIRALYIEYYTKTADLVQGQRDRMLEDKQKFGRVTFEVLGLERLNRLEIYYHEERLKLLRARRLQREHERNKIEQQLTTMSSTDLTNKIDDIEAQVCAQQQKVFDLRLEILQEEESMLKKKLNLLNKARRGESCEDGEFFDAMETLPEEDDVTPTDPEIDGLKEKLATVFRKRAAVRNKKKSCMSAWEKKKESEKARVGFVRQHHTVHMRRQERQKMDEQKKERIEEDRKATVQRLRAYRQRYKSLRSQNENSASNLLEDGSFRNGDLLVSSVAEGEHRIKTSPETSGHADALLPILIMNNKESSTSAPVIPSPPLFCPPPPPPPPLFSPPPPPPPPPLSTINCSDIDRSLAPKLEGVLHPSKKSVDATANKSNSNTGIDLRELQNVRKTLRKIPVFDDSKVNSEETSHEDKISEMIRIRSQLQRREPLEKDKENGDDVSGMLKGVLERIRQVTAESEESDSGSDSDFG